MRQWRWRADPTCLLDALTAALLSAGGICLALFLAGQGQSLGICLALAAGQALLCLAAGRRWWVLPALALGAGAAFGLWTLQAGWEPVRAALVRAWAWIAAGLPAGGDLEPLRLPVLGLCTLPVTLVFYALARRWLPVALPALYALALGLAAYLADLPAAEGVLLCALGGAMLCLPRAMASLGQDGLPRRYGQALEICSKPCWRSGRWHWLSRRASYGIRRMCFLSGYCWFFCFWAAVSGACFFAIFKGRARFWNRQSSKSKAVWMATRMHDWTATGRENFTVCFTPLMHWRQF